MDLAPICIFTYNRLSTLQNAIDALSKNHLINDSDVYIFSDGPRNDKDLHEVNKVRQYIKNSIPFKGYQVIEREHNLGLSQSITKGVTEIINRYGKVIVIEDDIVTSSSFLIYMNQALQFYENNDLIFSISGFSFPLKEIVSNKYVNYFTHRAYPWGWGTWKTKWDKVIWEKEILSDKISKHDRKFLIKGGKDLLKVLEFHFKGKVDSWDTVWAVNQILLHQYTVMPWISLTFNDGFGSNSTHCNGFNFHKTIIGHHDTTIFTFDPQPSENHLVSKAIRRKYSFRNKIWERLISIRRFSDLAFFMREFSIVFKRHLLK